MKGSLKDLEWNCEGWYKVGRDD